MYLPIFSLSMSKIDLMNDFILIIVVDDITRNVNASQNKQKHFTTICFCIAVTMTLRVHMAVVAVEITAVQTSRITIRMA